MSPTTALLAPLRGAGAVSAVRPRFAVAVLIAMLVLPIGCGDRGGKSVPRDERTQAPSAKPRGKAESGEQSVTGFGKEAGGGDRQAMLAAFDQYLRSIAARDYAAACSRLSKSVQESIRRLIAGSADTAECPALLSRLLPPTAAAVAREQSKGRVVRVRIDSGRGFVVFRAPGAELYQMPVLEQSGSWRVATITASVLAPELLAGG